MILNIRSIGLLSVCSLVLTGISSAQSAHKELPPCKSVGPNGVTVLNPAKIPCREVPLPHPEETPLTPEQWLKGVKEQPPQTPDQWMRSIKEQASLKPQWGSPQAYDESWKAGNEADGTPLYVCRSKYDGGLHPGKVVGGNCSIGWGGKEIVLPAFEVLTLGVSRDSHFTPDSEKLEPSNDLHNSR